MYAMQGQYSRVPHVHAFSSSSLHHVYNVQSEPKFFNF